MTNVIHSEQFVIKSEGRTCHKREFSFALNSHFEIGTSLSKIRPRKNQNMVSAPKPKKTRLSSSHEELKDNIVLETVAKDGDDVEKKMKNKKEKKNKNKKESNLRSEESKNHQPSPKHTTQTSNSCASPTTSNYRYFVCFIVVILFTI
jgi:hypothetical protein